MLARIYDARDDFASDTQLLTGLRSEAPVELFYRALTHYSASEFSRSLKAVHEIRERVLDWREDPSLLARFCYLAVKLYDKLERWEDLRSLDDLYIQQQLRRIRPIMPGAMFTWMTGHYLSAMALAALRAGYPDLALDHIAHAIDAARRQRSAALLLADRRVVETMVLQYMAVEAGADQCRWAWDDIVYARESLTRHGGLGSEDEVHFAGRYYGATVFLWQQCPLPTSDIPRVFGAPDVDLVTLARRGHRRGAEARRRHLVVRIRPTSHRTAGHRRLAGDTAQLSAARSGRRAATEAEESRVDVVVERPHQAVEHDVRRPVDAVAAGVGKPAMQRAHPFVHPHCGR